MTPAPLNVPMPTLSFPFRYLTVCIKTAVLLTVLFTSQDALSTESKKFIFGFNSLADWHEKSFNGHTTYTIEKSGSTAILHAVANGTASGLIHNITVSPREAPVIRWSWKVAKTVSTEDVHLKSGDDFAARVYIVFPAKYFWQTRAIIYVYSDKMLPGAVMPSPYTENVAVIAVASGKHNAGQWRHEVRKYVEDYRNYFKSEPPDPTAVAVMTDGDNTGSRAEAWYGEISFTAE